MSNVLVRPCRAQDAEKIFELVPRLEPLDHHTRYTYWDLCNNFGDSCFIATDKNVPVGFITSHPKTTPPDEWFIWQVGILPEYRGDGLINVLQERVVEASRASGAVALTLTIEEDNVKSLRVFERMATRIGASMEEIDRFHLTPDSPLAPADVEYWMSLLG